MKSKSYYYFIFIISGLLFLSLGICFSLLKKPVVPQIFFSLGTTIIAVVLINFLWEKSGGEPILKSLEILKKSSEIISDSIETGIFSIFHNRRRLNYSFINNEIRTAKEVFIISLVFRVAQSLELQSTISECVKNSGNVRILISAPKIKEKDKKPHPLELRQYAEKDSANRMESEIKDSIKFLEETKSIIENYASKNAKNFQYKLLSTHAIYCSIMGIDQRIYLTNYLNKYQGLDSPTLIIEKTNSPRSYYKIYKEEFEYLWKKAN